jgi:hypothetical protein
MISITQDCPDAVSFSYRSIDRLILNAYVPILQTPAAMAVFFREVLRQPILAGKVFKDLTDRFVNQVTTLARQRQIPILRPTGRTRPGEVAQRALKLAERADRWGLVAIVVHQESARVFASYHAGGRPTNFRVKQDYRLVNHYYFYFRDRAYGEGFVRICSYPPFPTRIWMNAHGYIAAQLRRRRIRFRVDQNCIVEVARPDALQEVADSFNAALVEQIARHWMNLIPSPLSAAEQAAGYSFRLSVYQAEFSDNVVFHKTAVLNRLYEHVLRDHLHLGRIDMVKVIFDRRIPRKTRSEFQTRILRQGTVSCLKVFHKRSFVKQYNKGGRVLRTEVCVNDPTDFNVRKSLVHLDYLGTIARHTLTRFLKAQAAAWSAALDRSTFERMITPSHSGGQRVAALRFGAPRTMRLLEGLGCAGLTFKAFANRDLRSVLIERLGTPASEATPARISYELNKLRGKGLIRKVSGRNLYALTDLGYQVALSWTKLHQRCLLPLTDGLSVSPSPRLTASAHYLDQAVSRINTEFDRLAKLCGLHRAG